MRPSAAAVAVKNTGCFAIKAICFSVSASVNSAMALLRVGSEPRNSAFEAPKCEDIGFGRLQRVASLPARPHAPEIESSAERRVGKEGVSRCRFWRSQDRYTKKRETLTVS